MRILFCPSRVPAAPIMPTGQEPEEVDTSQFYVQTSELEPCASPKAEAAALLDQLDSASWTVACAALVSARKLAAGFVRLTRSSLLYSLDALEATLLRGVVYTYVRGGVCSGAKVQKLHLKVHLKPAPIFFKYNVLRVSLFEKRKRKKKDKKRKKTRRLSS